MLAPVGGVDADFLNQKIDAPRHHRSLYFESQFQARTGKSVRTFNFALPGEMPSDAYLITKFLLKGEKRPDVLVYGVGPRDFMDNLLPSPSATDPYQYLSRFGNVDDRIDLMVTDWLERFGYHLGRFYYSYGNKGDICVSAQRSFAHLVTALLPAGDKPFGLAFRRQVLPGYRPFEVGPGECLFQPTTPSSRSRFTDNIGEYRKRYRQLKWDTFLTQMRFLAEILDTARERNTHVVIVSMPITDLNRRLLGEYAWSVYRHSVRVLALSKGASFVDMQGSGAFNQKDFGDTVHLHSGGGAKLLRMLAGNLAMDATVKEALCPHRWEEPGQEQVAGLKETRL